MKQKPGCSKSFVVRPKEVRILSRISKLCRRWDPLGLSHLSEVLSILIHSSWSLVSSFQWASYISWIGSSQPSENSSGHLHNRIPLFLPRVDVGVLLCPCDWVSAGPSAAARGSPWLSCSSVPAGVPVVDTLLLGDSCVTAAGLARRREQAECRK